MGSGEHSTSKNFLISSLFWLILFTTFGFILAVKFFAPEFLGQSAYLTFGRVRPMHVNGVAFGSLSTGLIGAAYYIVPRLTGTEIETSNPRVSASTVTPVDCVHTYASALAYVDVYSAQSVFYFLIYLLTDDV